MDSIVLVGAEDVARAGSTIQSAAESMRQSVGYLDDILLQYFARSEGLVERIEAAMEKPNLEFMNLDEEEFELLLERMKQMRKVNNG